MQAKPTNEVKFKMTNVISKSKTGASRRRRRAARSTYVAPLHNKEKPFEQWISGGDPPTDAQVSYANTIARAKGLSLDVSLHTKSTLGRWIAENRM